MANAPDRDSAQKSDLRPELGIFLPVFLVILLIAIPSHLNPQGTEQVVKTIFNWFSSSFGTLYLWIAIALISLSLYFALSRYGNIKFGEKDEKPEFSLPAWVAMIFCSGVAGAVMYWAIVEPVYNLMSPPHYAEPMSTLAFNLALPQLLFHWGPHAWCTYFLPALPLCYFFYIRKRPFLRVSAAMEGIINVKVNSPIGWAIDSFFILGLLMCTAVTMVLSLPTVAYSLNAIFGWDPGLPLQLGVLCVTTAIFATSACLGIAKGIKTLSFINAFIALGLVGFVLICGPTSILFSSFTDAVGRVFGNFITLSSWTDPWSTGTFPADWDIFYVLFWAGYGAFMSLFIARVSRGRTIREIILWGFAGALGGGFFIHGVVGSYTLWLQYTGALNTVEILKTQGEAALLVAVLQTLPLKELVLLVYVCFSTIFLATSADSSSFIMASVSSRSIVPGDEPARWLRLFWALCQAALACSLLFIGGLGIAKIFGNFSGALMIIPVLLMVYCWLKIVKYDGCRMLREYSAQEEESLEKPAWLADMN